MQKSIKILLFNYQGILRGFLDNTRRTLWFLARDAFLFALVLVLLAILFGEFLFYNYVLLTEIKDVNIMSSVAKFQEDTYKSVVEELAKRETIFNSPSTSNYQNPFKSESE